MTFTLEQIFTFTSVKLLKIDIFRGFVYTRLCIWDQTLAKP